MHLAQTLDLDFDLICGVWLQDFQYCVRFIAVGFQSLPYALSNHPGQENKDSITSKTHGVAEMSEYVNKELLCAHTEFMEHPVATETSFPPTAKMGPTCSRRYTHKKQRAFSWAASRSKLHPQRSQLSTEDSVFCIHLIPLERARRKKRNWYLRNLGFQRTQQVPWFQADLLWCGQATTIILRHPEKKEFRPSYITFPKVS